MPEPIPLRRRRKPQRKPMGLAEAAEYALRMISDAKDHLDGKTDTDSKAARQLIAGAAAELEAALGADVGAAAGELAPLMLRAMGRNVTVAEILGARRALEILLEALPDYSDLGPPL
jgi:hypothetical protein